MESLTGHPPKGFVSRLSSVAESCFFADTGRSNPRFSQFVTLADHYRVRTPAESVPSSVTQCELLRPRSASVVEARAGKQENQPLETARSRDCCPGRARTCARSLNRGVLCQLSYWTVCWLDRSLPTPDARPSANKAEAEGLEPSHPCGLPVFETGALPVERRFQAEPGRVERP